MVASHPHQRIHAIPRAAAPYRFLEVIHVAPQIAIGDTVTLVLKCRCHDFLHPDRLKLLAADPSDSGMDTMT